VTRGLKSTTDEAAADKKQSSHVQRILEERKKDAKIDPLLEQQFKAGRLLAAITSRPGQSGRADGHILEGKELDVSQDIRVVAMSVTDDTVLPQEAPDQEGQARRLGWVASCTMRWILYDADGERVSVHCSLGAFRFRRRCPRSG
jgi:hypothetical protein